MALGGIGDAFTSAGETASRAAGEAGKKLEEFYEQRRRGQSVDPIDKLSSMSGDAFKVQAMSFAKMYPDRADEFKEYAKQGYVDKPGLMSMESPEVIEQTLSGAGAMSTEPKTTGSAFADMLGQDAQPSGPSALDIVRGNIFRTRKELETATGDAAKALRAQEKTLIAQEKEIATERQKIADEASRRARALEIMQSRHQGATERAERNIADAERMVLNYEIDPNRAFKTTGSRLASAVAIAMSAFGQGVSGRGGPNTAYKIINDAINRDVDIQKEELRTRKDVLRNKNNLYAQMLNRFGSERSAELATQQAGIAAAVQGLEALKAVHKSENAQLNIDQQIAELQATGAKAKTQLLQLEGQLALAEARMAGKGGGGGKKDASLAKIKMALAQVKDLSAKFEEVGGVEGIFGTLVRGVLGEGAVPILTTEDVTTYEGLRSITAKFITNATDGGRPTDKDFAILLSLIPPSGTSRQKGRAMIGQLEKILERAAAVGGMSVGPDGVGFLERYAKDVLGKDPNVIYGEFRGEVEDLKDELGFKEGR